MKQNLKEKIQMHIDEARKLAAEMGMELEDFINKEPEMEEEEGEEEDGEEMPMGKEKPMPNRGKIALIIAKMKNKNKEY